MNLKWFLEIVCYFKTIHEFQDVYMFFKSGK